MKLTLTENAVNSLKISVNAFYKFYYSGNKPMSPQEEMSQQKIGLTFLENSIELLLKCILLKSKSGDIFKRSNKEPTKTVLAKALKRAQETGETFEDILLEDSQQLKTISYSETVDMYGEYTRINKKYSEKANRILHRLGNYRNPLTHFGIDFSDNFDELICCFVETFDVIYNYLYPDFISLVTEEDMYRDTNGNLRYDSNGFGYFKYDDLVDFLDELLIDTSQKYVMELCLTNKERKISKFMNIVEKMTNSKSVGAVLNEDITIENWSRGSWPSFSFRGIFETELSPIYSSYFNASIYENEGGVAFIVIHSNNTIYEYTEYVDYPFFDEAESDEQWIDDEKNGKCVSFKITESNLIGILNRWADKISDEVKDW